MTQINFFMGKLIALLLLLFLTSLSQALPSIKESQDYFKNDALYVGAYQHHLKFSSQGLAAKLNGVGFSYQANLTDAFFVDTSFYYGALDEFTEHGRGVGKQTANLEMVGLSALLLAQTTQWNNIRLFSGAGVFRDAYFWSFKSFADFWEHTQGLQYNLGAKYSWGKYHFNIQVLDKHSNDYDKYGYDRAIETSLNMGVYF